jgi:SsrA-binding protein
MAKPKKKIAPGDVATNRQASYRFEFLDRMEAGMVLTGSEVKSLRTTGATIKDGFATIKDGEIWLHNVHIPPYVNSLDNHEPERTRKLLLHRRELEKLLGVTKEKGSRSSPSGSTSTARRRRSRSRSPAARTSSTSARRSRSARTSATCSARSARRTARRRPAGPR